LSGFGPRAEGFAKQGQGMASNFIGPGSTSVDSEAASGYVPPKLVVLGTLVELTQLGSAHTDELLNDGSQP
jgi:hypothetical protein